MNLKCKVQKWLNGHDISDELMRGRISRLEYERRMEKRGMVILLLATTIGALYYLVLWL